MPLPPEDPPAGVPDWILTYGDLMSLLLCFFVLLAGMSELKTEKKDVLIAALLQQFGDPETVEAFLAAAKGHLHDRKKGLSSIPSNDANASEKKRAASNIRGKRGKAQNVQTIRDGKRTTIGGPALFEPGSTKLTNESKESLREIAEGLRGKRHIVEVKGYEPLGPSGRDDISPLDLAFQRARTVADFLASEGVRRNVLRVTVAASVENNAVPKLDDGQPMLNRVEILTLETIVQNFD